MAEVEINIRDEMRKQIDRLTVKQYEDDSEASRKRVIQTALKMRTLWSYSIIKGQDETEEAISYWEFPQSAITSENGHNINEWLFRR
jgi:hypothetical protein